MCYIVNCPLAQRRCVQIKPDKMAQKRLDYRRRITFWYMVLLLTAFLFSFDASGYQGISHVKFWVLLGLNAAYFAAMALLTMDQFLTGQLKGCKPLALWRRAGWSQRLVFLYMGFSWLSAVCSPWWPATVLGASRLEGALSITIYCLSFLLVSTYGQADRRLLGVLGMSVTLFCLLCLVQMAGFNPFGLYPDGYGYADAGMAYSGAYLGTIGNVDLVAAFLALVSPILLYALVRLPGRLKWILLVPLALALVVLVRMSVMAGLIGAGAGCFLSLPAAGVCGSKARRNLALLVGSTVLLGLAAMFLVDFGGELPHQVHMLLHGKATLSFGSGRLFIWSQVLGRVPEHLLLGTGPDTMLFAQFTPFTRYAPELGRTIVAQIDTAHNEYLNILYHQGLPALAAYLGMLAVLAVGWLHISTEDVGAAILGAGVLGYCVQAFWGISCPLAAPFFWIALGLLAGRVEKILTKIFRDRCAKVY